MKFGCHAVLFKEAIKNDTEEILKGIAATGFQGFEMGSRFFGTEDRGFLKEMLEKYNLELTGMHVGGPLNVWAENPEENMLKVMAAAEFMKEMPNKNVILSGNNFPEGDVITAAKNIDTAATQCAALGVKLHYHNHDWEFLNDGRVYKALVEYAPSVSFAFDLGWVYKGGFDPIKVITEHASRISYLHLRDPKEKEGRIFPDLGEGIFDYTKLMKTVQSILAAENWAIVEYDKGDINFDRYTKARDFLKGFGY